MEVRDPRTINPVIVCEVSRMFTSGCDRDQIIERMRTLGLNKVECIKLFRDYGRVTLGEAKDIVHLSPAWADRYQSDEAFHDAAEQALNLLHEQERSAA